ncbi:MAG: efflux RND transporter periplasmic adaptor subunit [Deltaproteobacteria bacterium]
MPKNYKISRFPATGILLGTLLFSGCGKPPAGPHKAMTPEVAVVTVTPKPVTLTRELPGRTSPHLIAEVRPQVGGIIKKRLFVEGSDVKAGQVLYQIDPAPYEAVVASAEASLARAKTGKTQADAILARAEANLTPLRLKADRYKELVPVKAVSSQDLDDATAAFHQGEADIQTAKAAILGADAEIGVAEAALETARINLAYTKVTAPIAGRIGRSLVTTGALVKASQDNSLATIQELDPIYIDFTQSSVERLRLMEELKRGQIKHGGSTQAKIRLLLEDGSSYPEEGILKFSDVTVDPSTGSVTLRALFPNPHHLLLPGMFVRGIVQEGVREQGILVPQRGVTRNPAGEAMVMVVGAEDKVEPRMIEVDRTVGNDWLVNGGLQPGDRVILEGIQRARPGTQVKVVPFGTGAENSALAPHPPAAK